MLLAKTKVFLKHELLKLKKLLPMPISLRLQKRALSDLVAVLNSKTALSLFNTLLLDQLKQTHLKVR